jgi:hypothetical protein
MHTHLDTHSFGYPAHLDTQLPELTELKPIQVEIFDILLLEIVQKPPILKMFKDDIVVLTVAVKTGKNVHFWLKSTQIASAAS